MSIPINNSNSNNSWDQKMTYLQEKIECELRAEGGEVSEDILTSYQELCQIDGGMHKAVQRCIKLNGLYRNLKRLYSQWGEPFLVPPPDAKRSRKEGLYPTIPIVQNVSLQQPFAESNSTMTPIDTIRKRCRNDLLKKKRVENGGNRFSLEVMDIVQLLRQYQGIRGTSYIDIARQCGVDYNKLIYFLYEFPHQENPIIDQDKIDGLTKIGEFFGLSLGRLEPANRSFQNPNFAPSETVAEYSSSAVPGLPTTTVPEEKSDKIDPSMAANTTSSSIPQVIQKLEFGKAAAQNLSQAKQPLCKHRGDAGWSQSPGCRHSQNQLSNHEGYKPKTVVINNNEFVVQYQFTEQEAISIHKAFIFNVDQYKEKNFLSSTSKACEALKEYAPEASVNMLRSCAFSKRHGYYGRDYKINNATLLHLKKINDKFKETEVKLGT